MRSYHFLQVRHFLQSYRIQRHIRMVTYHTVSTQFSPLWVIIKQIQQRQIPIDRLLGERTVEILMFTGWRRAARGNSYAAEQAPRDPWWWGARCMEKGAWRKVPEEEQKVGGRNKIECKYNTEFRRQQNHILSAKSWCKWSHICGKEL